MYLRYLRQRPLCTPNAPKQYGGECLRIHALPLLRHLLALLTNLQSGG